jgi:hypothetical protein
MAKRCGHGNTTHRHKKFVNRYVVKHLKTLDENLIMIHDEDTRQGRLRFKGLPYGGQTGI